MEWEDKTNRLAKQAQEKSIAEENARVRQALDCVTTNVMIADNDALLTYYNPALERMMRNAEADLKKYSLHLMLIK